MPQLQPECLCHTLHFKDGQKKTHRCNAGLQLPKSGVGLEFIIQNTQWAVHPSWLFPMQALSIYRAKSWRPGPHIINYGAQKSPCQHQPFSPTSRDLCGPQGQASTHLAHSKSWPTLPMIVWADCKHPWAYSNSKQRSVPIVCLYQNVQLKYPIAPWFHFLRTYSREKSPVLQRATCNHVFCNICNRKGPEVTYASIH